MVPYLFDAATLSGEQGIKAILENSKVLRAYVGTMRFVLRIGRTIAPQREVALGSKRMR